MDRNNRHHSKNNRRNWNDAKQKNNNDNHQAQQVKHPVIPPEVRQDMAEKEKAIRDFKAREVICPMCGQPIADLSSALADKTTGKPVHFDCVLAEIAKNEKLTENEKITYIGQGRFAVLLFENPRDMRHFKIERTIEWEERNKEFDWRSEIAGLYSQVKQI